ncbi:unnamed protein product [Microthlaspi erraticum]|uniref:Uncharacterized protein n=1 Tax=Microthlaspi erraticum TaxID=1685480 RepID=A0A6D2L0S5_9BRAS|nr:unnamed protein product [Microthlaspi erraticum]
MGENGDVVMAQLLGAIQGIGGRLDSSEQPPPAAGARQRPIRQVHGQNNQGGDVTDEYMPLLEEDPLSARNPNQRRQTYQDDGRDIDWYRGRDREEDER